MQRYSWCERPNLVKPTLLQGNTSTNLSLRLSRLDLQARKKERWMVNERLREVELTLSTCQPEKFITKSPVKLAQFCETHRFWRNIQHTMIWKFKIWPAKYWLAKLGTGSSLQNLRNNYGLVLFYKKLSVRRGGKRYRWRSKLYWFRSTDNYKLTHAFNHNFKTRIELGEL